MDAFTIALNSLLIIVLIALNGFFVAAEFTIVKVRPSQLAELIADGNTRAKYAQKLVDNMDVSLSVTQLGITLVSLGLGWVGEPFLGSVLRPLFALVGVTGSAVDTISFAVAFSIITAGHIILGELAPKNVAIQKALAVLLWISPPLLLFQHITYPIVWILNHVANFVIRTAGFEVVKEQSDAHSEDEIRILMAESRKHGFIDKTEYDFVDNVFDFSDLEVRDIMTPRTDMVCLYLEDGMEKNIRVALEHHLTRYPICREDKDDIIGFLHIKDLLSPLCEGEKPDLNSLARRALVVPEAMPVSRLLSTMQQKKAQLAIVVDEYGGTAGMATIEDVVEEIVGDIQDEFDQERPSIEHRGANTYSLDARLTLDDVNDILEMHIESDNIDTIGGWLYAQVDAPPRIGQHATAGDSMFIVEEMANVRITRVLVRLGHELTEPHDEIKEAASKKPQAKSAETKK